MGFQQPRSRLLRDSQRYPVANTAEGRAPAVVVPVGARAAAAAALTFSPELLAEAALSRLFVSRENRYCGAVEKPHSCHPERSEGSSNSRRINIAKILRCAQNDKRRLLQQPHCPHFVSAWHDAGAPRDCPQLSPQDRQAQSGKAEGGGMKKEG